MLCFYNDHFPSLPILYDHIRPAESIFIVGGDQVSRPGKQSGHKRMIVILPVIVIADRVIQDKRNRIGHRIFISAPPCPEHLTALRRPNADCLAEPYYDRISENGPDLLVGNPETDLPVPAVCVLPVNGQVSCKVKDAPKICFPGMFQIIGGVLRKPCPDAPS